MSRTLLEFGLIKFYRISLKISKEAELQISITDGEKELLKELCLTLKGVMLSGFLIVRNLLLLGIKSNKYGGDSS